MIPLRHVLSLAPLVATLAACSTPPDTAARPADASLSATDGAADVSIADATSADAGSVPTWSEHVAPIVFRNCVGCHREGGIAPFGLTTYPQASSVAELMSREVSARRMPPTVINASGSCNQFRDDVKWLTGAEIQTIAHWAAGGAPEGDRALLPPVPAPPGGLPRVDARVDIGTSYMPEPGRADQYRCFIANPGLTADRFITGFEVVPGDRRVVHHVILYSLPTAEAEQSALALEAEDAQPGYTCFGGPGATGSAPLALWAPGGEATQFPAGTGLRINGGRRVVIQVHYNVLNGAFPDRTAVQLQLAERVDSEARLTPMVATDINIPPRTAMTTVTAQRAIGSMAPRGARVWGTAPHMHEIGRVQRLSSSGGGATTCLSDVTQWNFHWQRLHFYRAPIELDANQTIAIECGYDSSMRTAATRRGEGTQDEMCLNYLYVTAR